MLFIPSALFIVKEKDMKREYRDCPESVKEKLRQNPKLHQPRSTEVRQKIANSMTQYWRTVPNKPISGTQMLKDGDIV